MIRFWLCSAFFFSSKFSTLEGIRLRNSILDESVHNRVFGARTSFMEVLARVIDRARWFFVFIILTMVSVSLSFAVLYKDDAVDLFSLFFMRLDEQI